VLKCPSDEGVYAQTDTNSYAFSVGDQINNIRDDRTVRGLFSREQCVRFSDIKDGTSNTAMMSERLSSADHQYSGQNCTTIGPRQMEHVKGYAENVSGLSGSSGSPAVCFAVSDGRYFVGNTCVHATFGTNWHDGQPALCAFNTVLPPNAPGCSEGGSWADARNAVFPPASRHPGGVNLLMADGSVRFISETIDTGDLTLPEVNQGPSPYGVWGALGSKAGGEGISLGP